MKFRWNIILDPELFWKAVRYKRLSSHINMIVSFNLWVMIYINATIECKRNTDFKLFNFTLLCIYILLSQYDILVFEYTFWSTTTNPLCKFCNKLLLLTCVPAVRPFDDWCTWENNQNLIFRPIGTRSLTVVGGSSCRWTKAPMQLKYNSH